MMSQGTCPHGRFRAKGPVPVADCGLKYKFIFCKITRIAHGDAFFLDERIA